MKSIPKDRTSVSRYVRHAQAISSTIKQRLNAFRIHPCVSLTNTMIRQLNNVRTIVYCARLKKLILWNCTNVSSRHNVAMTSFMMTRLSSVSRSHHCAVSLKSMIKLLSNVPSSTILLHHIQKIQSTPKEISRSILRTMSKELKINHSKIVHCLNHTITRSITLALTVLRLILTLIYKGLSVLPVMLDLPSILMKRSVKRQLKLPILKPLTGLMFDHVYFDKL